MPTQSRGFFACDFCGLQHDTLEEATEHEQTQCPRAIAATVARRPLGSIPPAQGLSHHYPNYFLHQQQQAHRHGFTTGTGPLGPAIPEGPQEPYRHTRPPYAGYGRGFPPGSAFPPEASYSRKHPALGAGFPHAQKTSKPKCFALVNYPDDPSAERLTMIDKMVCQNVEVFEASPEIVADYQRKNPNDMQIDTSQVAIRCRNCGSGSNNNSGNPVGSTPGAIVFPVDIVTMGDSVRKIADHHLASCTLTSPDVKAACQEVAAKRQQHLVETGDDEASKAALVDYCSGFCQQLGIRKRGNNKSGLEFIGSSTHAAGDSSTAQLQTERDLPFSTVQSRPMAVVGGTRGVAPPPIQTRQHSHQDRYPESFPYYQESDRTWHCKYCSYIHPHLRDSHAIWSSPSGDPPPNRFIDQHLSICRGYQQQNMPPNSGIISTVPPPFGALAPPYSNPPSSQQGLPGQPPHPHASWEAAAAGGAVGPQGSIHPHHMQHSYPGLLPYQDPSYRYGQPPPPTGLLPSSAMDSSLSGGRFLPTIGRGDSKGGYLERSITSSLPSSGQRGQSYAHSSVEGTDSLKNAMAFLENYEADYLARDPSSAEIPKLVFEEDHLLLTDYFFWLMRQLRLVRFTENDRKTRGGKREKIKVGYGGLQCIHCADQPMSRKFFWSNVDRLANSFAEIPGHILKCRRCPEANKNALLLLKKEHSDQMSNLPRGSQKIFFRRMWRRLHEGDPQDDDLGGESKEKVSPLATEKQRPPVPSIKTSPEKSIEDLSHSGSITVTSDETILVMHRSAKEAAAALAESARKKTGPLSPSSRILVAIPEDKEWLSDIDSYVRKQLEVFCATEQDVRAAEADKKYPISVGQVGIRCIHCAMVQGHNAIGHAIAYPFSISGIYESVKEFHRVHLDSCPHLPASTKTKLESMKGASSLSSVLRKYYTLSAKALGLVDTKQGIRTGGQSTPIGSIAAFTFTETEERARLSKMKAIERKESESPGRKPSPPGRKHADINEEGFDEAAGMTSKGIKRSGSPSISQSMQSSPKARRME